MSDIQGYKTNIIQYFIKCIFETAVLNHKNSRVADY